MSSPIVVEYGPPAHKGVTSLMSVGDAVAVEPTPLEQQVTRLSWWAAGVWLGASLLGLRDVSAFGRGALGGLVAARVLARRGR